MKLTLQQARRIAITAQGLADPCPEKIDVRHLRRVLGKVGLLQIDSVNVLARAHYIPLFSRLGPYPMRLLDDYAYRRRRLFEYLGARRIADPDRAVAIVRLPNGGVQGGTRPRGVCSGRDRVS